MSLVVWLPLNGDLHNQGLSDAEVTNNGAVVDNNGKTGPCYRFETNAKYLTLNKKTYELFNDGDSFSYCCWIKITAYASSSSGSGAGGSVIYQTETSVVNGVTKNGGGFGILINTAGSATANANPFGKPNFNVTIGTIPLNKWTHIAMTYEKSTKTLSAYFNGTFVRSAVASLDWGANGRNFIFGKGSQGGWGYSSNNYQNDIRIYDHCLSAREVHEIFKGLVCHYKLSEQIVYKNSDKLKYDKTIYIEPDNSMWVRIFHHNNPGATLFSSSSTWANGVYVNEDVWFDIYDTVNSLSSYEFMVKQKLKSTDSEVKYRWIQNKSPLTAVYNDVAPGAVTRITTSGYTNGTFGGLYVKNSNTHMSIANANANNWYGAIGSWTAFNSGIPGYPNTVVTTGYMDLYVRINSDSVPEINDYSGYKHNGVIVGSLSASNDTERYNYSLTFSNNNYAAIGRGGMVVDEITVSWWGKMSNWGSYGRAISCTEGGGWNFEPADSKLRFAINLNGTYVLASDTNTLSSLGSDWHHFAGTYDRTNVKFYRDGELITTTPAPSANVNIKYHASNGIFIGAEAAASAATGQSPYFPGKLSDIRIYATALSAEDIYELYHTPAYIDNQGDMMEYEIHEDETTQPKILKIGEVKANKFKELNMYLYLPAGSYVNTGLNYDNGDECKAETVIKYSGGSGRDLMGYSPSGAGYWGVKAAGTWEPHGTFTYTNADISVPNFITYTFSSASEHGIYQIGRLASSYSVRNKYVYNVKLYKNGVLERNLYPDVQDSSAGLFDILNGVFYPAVGNPSVGIETDDNICRKFKNHIKSTYFEEI